jgi:glycosyltransferase involved in cell wall biosynthesis
MAKKIVLIFEGLGSGGVQRSMLKTAAALSERGYAIDLCVGDARGEFAGEVPDGTRVVELEVAPLWRVRAQILAADPGNFSRLIPKKVPGRMRCLPSLAQHFRIAKPDAIFAACTRYNLMAVWARRLAGLASPVIVSQRDQASNPTLGAEFIRENYSAKLIRRVYLQADTIVAVSDGIADDLAKASGIPRDRITTVYNPVIGPDVHAKARQPLDHPWFAAGEPPVVLGVGRLRPQKDFPTLVRAFAKVRSRRPSRLVILGAAPDDCVGDNYLQKLKGLPGELGVADDVRFEGFTANPFAYMARSSVFVLSSEHEGLPGVLIQAMACGCPVVSTDCVSGPREILDHGRLGPLVEVGDDDGMATAIESALDHPHPSDQLKERANLYSVDRAADRYIKLLFG